MKSKVFVISAKFSDFKDFLTDSLFKLTGNTSMKPRKYRGNDFSTHLEYLIFGAVFDYKILPIEESLNIVLSVSDHQNKNVQTHFDEISQAIRNNFISASFPTGFINLAPNREYSKMLEYMWSESEETQQAGAYLSTIILLGSILEGMLLCKLELNPRPANQSPKAPKENDQVKSFKDWKLTEMIEVCFERGWMSDYPYKHSHTLREHRNFVHPWKQLNNNLAIPNDPSCNISREVVKAVLDDLIKDA